MYLVIIPFAICLQFHFLFVCNIFVCNPTSSLSAIYVFKIPSFIGLQSHFLFVGNLFVVRSVIICLQSHFLFAWNVFVRNPICYLFAIPFVLRLQNIYVQSQLLVARVFATSLSWRMGGLQVQYHPTFFPFGWAVRAVRGVRCKASHVRRPDQT